MRLQHIKSCNFQLSTYMSRFSLKGKTALITGGGTGIGLGIAQEFITAGARVVITGRTEQVLKEAVTSLGAQAFYYVHDASVLPSIEGLFLQIENDLGPVDILVNNAGRHLKADVVNTSDEAFAEVIALNLNAVFAFSREFAKRAIALKRKGAILMISSMSPFIALDGVAAYASGKAGLQGLILTLMAELSQYGIRVNAVAPGFIESQMMLDVMKRFPAREAKVKSRILLGRWGKPQDIGHAAVYLCSDAAAYVTGVILPVDGGMVNSL
jgi:gluconate 5-dehydrogenase